MKDLNSTYDMSTRAEKKYEKNVISTENHSACAFYKNINYVFSEGFGSLKNSLK